jgi:hypothetical protein
MKLVFLDIDGVLNTLRNYDWGSGPTCLISPHLVKRLNRIVQLPGIEVVISSSWRYQILHGATTVRGFQHMLRSHGLDCHIHGHTAGDHDCPIRGRQIAKYLEDVKPLSYVIIDDDTSEYLDAVHGERVVFTDPATGLSDMDITRAQSVLGKVLDDSEYADVLRKYRSLGHASVE